MRKAELIAFLQDNEPQALRQQRPPHPNRPPPPPPQMSTWELQRKPQTGVRQPELEEAPLTKRQLKCRRNKDSKLAKKFKGLDAEISNLKSQMGTLKDKITKASKSTIQEEEDQKYEKGG